MHRLVFKTLLNLIVLVSCLNTTALAADLEPLVLNVVVVKEPSSLWTESEILNMFVKTNKILAQCDIYIDVTQKVISAESTIAMGFESVPLSNAYYAQYKTPIVLLVNGVQYNKSAGFTPGANAVFVSQYSRTEEYQKERHSDYETLAHELGHMLGQLEHLASPKETNLMAGYINRQSAILTSDQCLRMRKHAELKPQLKSF